MPDLHTVTSDVSEDERELMEPRMMAFIFPNKPRSCEERKAFDQAVKFQIDHEKSLAERTSDAEIPEGTKAFTIGSFHMEFAEGVFDSRLTRKTICPSAYGVLLQAGLLYRGVEGRCPHGDH